MAIVKGPALSLAASGNLGTICYSRWRSLAIARDVWSGTVPNTGKQVTQQGYLIGVAQAWGGSLSPGQRETWKERAKEVIWTDRMGDPYIPSGYQLFMKWNIRRKVMNLVIMSEAPGIQEWVMVGELRLGFDPVGQLIFMRVSKVLGAGVNVESYGVEYWKAGPYNSGGRKPIDGEWRFLRREVPPSAYLDVDFIANKWYWYKGRAIAEFGDVQNWFTKQVQAV